MKDSAFLIFNRNGIARLAKGQRRRGMPRTRPALGAGEYAVLVSLVVPDAVFKPAPLPEATITVRDADVIAPLVEVRIDPIPPGIAADGEGSL
jgi:hypothetical protein